MVRSRVINWPDRLVGSSCYYSRKPLIGRMCAVIVDRPSPFSTTQGHRQPALRDMVITRGDHRTLPDLAITAQSIGRRILVGSDKSGYAKAPAVGPSLGRLEAPMPDPQLGRRIGGTAHQAGRKIRQDHRGGGTIDIKIIRAARQLCEHS